MKRKGLKLSLFVIIVACFFVACKPESFDTFGNMSGTVIDVDSGEPISQATITLSPSSKNTYTGLDGQFEFLDLESQQYTVTVQKNGYETNRKIVNVVAGETVQVSLVMQFKGE